MVLILEIAQKVREVHYHHFERDDRFYNTDTKKYGTIERQLVPCGYRLSYDEIPDEYLDDCGLVEVYNDKDLLWLPTPQQYMEMIGCEVPCLYLSYEGHVVHYNPFKEDKPFTVFADSAGEAWLLVQASKPVDFMSEWKPPSHKASQGE